MNLPQPPVLVWHVLNAACVGAIAYAGGASRSAAWGAFAFALGCMVAWWIAGVRNGVAGERRRLEATRRCIEDGAEFESDFDRVFTTAEEASAWLEDLDQVERDALHEAVMRRLAEDPRLARIALMAAESCPSAAAHVLRGIRGHAVVCTRRPLEAVCERASLDLIGAPWRYALTSSRFGGVDGDDRRCVTMASVQVAAVGERGVLTTAWVERPVLCRLTPPAPCGVPGDRAARQTPRGEIVTPAKPGT